MSLKSISKDNMVESIFTEDSFKTVSKKYVHLSTSTLIEDMEKLGWLVSKTSEVKVRKPERKGYQKHLVTFFNPGISLHINGINSEPLIPQILISNSHDGKNSFKFRMGIYRILCTNGLVVSVNEFTNFSVKHFGYNVENLKTTIDNYVIQIPFIIEKIRKFDQFILDENQIENFTKNALQIRFGKENYNKYNFNLKEISSPLREEDNSPTLWKVFNRIQEKIMNGMLSITNKETLKESKVKSIKSINKNLQINEDLWELADSFYS